MNIIGGYIVYSNNVRFLTDVSLLIASRGKPETIIDILDPPAIGKKPRTYGNVEGKYFVSCTKKCRLSMKDVRKALSK